MALHSCFTACGGTMGLRGVSAKEPYKITMACRWLTGASVLILLTSCLGQGRESIDVGIGVSTLVGAAESTKATGPREYLGHCDGSPDFPKVHAPRNIGAPSVEVFRDIFSKDPMMTVKRDISGKIRL